MKRLTLFTVFLIITALVAVPLFAQDAAAILEYYDDDFEIVITDADGNDYEFISFGMELLPGDSIETFASTAEIRLEPNGSIIKIGEDSVFTIDSIAGYQGSNSSDFSLAVGRIRTVAATVAGTGGYNFRTPTSVGGVRGTEFVMNYVPGEVDELGVLEGSVEFVNTQTGESVVLGAGQGANTFAAIFEAVEWAQSKFAEFLDALDFQELNPNDVPRETVADEGDAGDDDTDDGGSSPDTAPPVVVEPPTEDDDDDEGTAGAAAPPAEPTFIDNAMDWLGDIFGADIGSVTLDGETWAKAVLQPTFEFGDFRMGLYLPIIYQNNLFDPMQWYRPKGNNEWSFGTDEAFTGQENEVLLRIGDILSDLALKIRFMEYGDLRDPFFFKVGNVSGLTVGHGLLMRDYANDSDFPAVRRTGVNLGLDLGGFGFEAVVNDLGEPEIFGGRIYVRPFHPGFNLAFGPSAVADIDPAGDLPATNQSGTPVFVQTRTADPAFLNVAFDLDLGIIETDFFTLVAFADAGGLIPVLGAPITDINGQEIPAGLRTEALFTTTPTLEFNNFGITAGFLGNIAVFDYRLEFQWFDGAFRPGFFGPQYDRLRGERAQEVVNYLVNPNDPAYDRTTLGVFGSGGATIAEVFTFEFGYLWPWYFDENGLPQYSDSDRFILRLGAEEGLIPLGITANISYERTKFIPTLIAGTERNLTLFDANTVFKGEVVVPVAPILDLAAVISTAVRRDASGDVVYDANNNPVIAPTISIETRIGF